MVEAAIGERAAQAFVEEQEEERNLNPFGGETIGVAGAVALQQPMAFELAQVVDIRSSAVRFATDSPVERDGFELPVPRGWIEH